MAMRHIPHAVEYARLVERDAPTAWVISFTNPVGIVTQAMTSATRARVIGICDTPTELFEDVAHVLGVDSAQCSFDYFGLNHLGWLREVRVGGEPKLQRLWTTTRAAAADLPRTAVRRRVPPAAATAADRVPLLLLLSGTRARERPPRGPDARAGDSGAERSTVRRPRRRPARTDDAFTSATSPLATPATCRSRSGARRADRTVAVGGADRLRQDRAECRARDSLRPTAPSSR